MPEEGREEKAAIVNLISFARTARNDLGEIYFFIAEDSIEVADRLMNLLQLRWQVLVEHPRIGRERNEFLSELRSLTEGNYVIFYRILVEEIQIVRVLQSSRDFSEAFSEFDE